MADETDVGSIVAHLRIDASEWNRVLREAQRQAEELGRTNPNIRITTNGAELQAQLATINAQLDDLKAQNVKLRFDLTEAQAQIAKLREEAKEQGKKSGEDFGGEFNRNVQKSIREALAAIPKIDVDANTTPANRKLQEIRVRMDELAAKKIGVDITAADALAKLKVLQAELDKLNRKSKDDIRIRVDTAAAAAKIAALREEMEGLDKSSSTSAAGGTPNLLIYALAAGATLAGPLLGAATAGAVELGGAVGVAALAYKGLQDQEERQTRTGIALQSSFRGIGKELHTLETIASNEAGPGVLAALGRVKAFLPQLDGPTAGLAKHLGNALNIAAGGTITGLRTMLPLLNDGGTYAERLAQKFAQFTASSQFSQFMNYARAELPIVSKDLGDIVAAAVHVGTALQPYGDDLLVAIDRTATLTSKTADLLKLLNSNSTASGGDGSDIFGFQKRYQESVGKHNKGFLDYINIGLGAGDPLAGKKPAAVTPNQSNAAAEAAGARMAAQAAHEQASALAGVARSYGMTVPAYQAATAATQKDSAARLTAIDLMKRESDAGGLLKDALDRLNGKQLSAAQAQNQFEQALVSQLKATKKSDAAVIGLSSSAITNRGNLLNLVTAAESAAEAYGSLDKSGEKTNTRLKDLRQQIINNAVANGMNRAAVVKYIDSVMKIPPVAKTKVDLDSDAARAKVAAFKAFVATLPKSIRTAVLLGGVSTAEYQLQLLARNRTARISVVTSGQGATGVHSVGGVQANADGGTVRGAGGPREDKVLMWASPGEEVVNAAASAKHRTLIKAINADKFADGGTVGGIVTLTPTRSQVAAKAKAAAKTKAKKGRKPAKPKLVTVALSATAGHGQAYGLSSYIKGQIPSAAAASRMLATAVNDAFHLKGIQAKIAATRADIASVKAQLDNVQQARSQLVSTTRSSLMGVDITKYGDAGMLNSALLSNAGTSNKFTAQIARLKAEKVPAALLEQLASAGPSAGLDTLARESRGQLQATLRAYGAYSSAAARGSGLAGNAVYGAQISADQRRIAADNRAIVAQTKQAAATEAAMIRAVHTLSEVVKRPIKVSVGGHEFAHAVVDAGVVQGVYDDIARAVKYGRRP